MGIMCFDGDFKETSKENPLRLSHAQEPETQDRG
jgi:hypothetical protein